MIRRFNSFVCLFGAVVLSPFLNESNLRADLLLIQNPGFEDLVLGNGGFTPNIPGWTRSGDSGTFNPNASAYAGGLAPEGENVAYSSFGGPWVSQVLTATLTADTVYELSMLVGNRLNTAFPGYLIELRAGDTLLASDNNSLAPIDGEFLLSIVSYTALAGNPLLGQNLEIRFRSFGQQANFDDVRLSASAVPEPSGFLLCSSLVIGLLLARRRVTAWGSV